MSVSVFILNSSELSAITISGFTPTLEIDFPDGRKYLETVSLIAPSLSSGIIDWTDPLPYVLSPTNIALLWSCRAPATISDADAEP